MGEFWLAVEGHPQPWQLTAGSFALLSGGKAFRLHSAPDVPAVDAFRFFPAVPAGEIAVLNGGGGCQGVGGYFDFEGMHAELLLGMLPPVVFIGAEEGHEDLRWSIERLMRDFDCATSHQMDSKLFYPFSILYSQRTKFKDIE